MASDRIKLNRLQARAITALARDRDRLRAELMEVGQAIDALVKTYAGILGMDQEKARANGDQDGVWLEVLDESKQEHSEGQGAVPPDFQPEADLPAGDPAPKE